MACDFTGVARKLTSSEPVYKRSFWKVVGNPEVHDRDIVARYGGEEFTVIVDSSEGEDTATVAERVRSAVEALGIQHHGSPFEYVTLSIGLAYTRTAGTSAQMLLNEADAALYEAKRNGRNQVRAPKRDSRWEAGPYQ
jgi:diguanylate cyclase (GGDEF)-like protein